MLREMQLVWRFNRGHTDALREIYEQHKHDLVTLATALLIDKSEAEDVVHDVCVGFIQSGGRFHEPQRYRQRQRHRQLRQCCGL